MGKKLFHTTKASCIARRHQSPELPFICFAGDGEFDTQISTGAQSFGAETVFHGAMEINPDGKREPVPRANIYYEGTMPGFSEPHFCFSKTDIDDGLIELIDGSE